MAFSRSFVAGNGVATRPEWTPEESARFEFELCRLLATDRGEQSVYFRKLSPCAGRGMALRKAMVQVQPAGLLVVPRHRPVVTRRDAARRVREALRRVGALRVWLPPPSVNSMECHTDGAGAASGTAGGAAVQTGRGPPRRGTASAGDVSSRGRAVSVAPPSVSIMECHTDANVPHGEAAADALAPVDPAAPVGQQRSISYKLASVQLPLQGSHVSCRVTRAAATRCAR